MTAIALWVALWNAADYDQRDTLFHLGCQVFGAPLMFAAVTALTDVETDRIDLGGYSGGAY